MQKIVLNVLVRNLLPALAGAAGAYVLTNHPEVYAAICQGPT